jgi:hypothetical protein
MNFRKSFSILLIVALFAGVAAWGTTFAESPVHDPLSPTKENASSLIVGVPFEDVGNVLDAGVINVVAGVNDSGLTPSANIYYSQTKDNAGTPEKNDQYGLAVASGDFDHNGLNDIAIGVPGEDNRMGAIDVIFFHDDGSSLQAIIRENYWLKQNAHAGDEFGSTLVAGDFNGDGLDDLAVGAPGYNHNAGAVLVLHGDEGETLMDYDAFFGTNQELFGYALARADFDADGINDLAVGCPNADVGILTTIRSGKVRILYGPLDAAFVRHQDWTQSATGQGVSEEGDAFGETLVTGDFNGDGRADLAIGVPNEDRGNVQNTGAVNVLYNNQHDLSKTGAKVWFMGAAQKNKFTGISLAVGDFDGDDSDDLVIGSPYEDSATVEDAGRVDVIWGAPATKDVTTFLPPNNKFGFLGYALLGINLTGYDHDDLVMGVPGFSSPGHTRDGAIAVSYGGVSGLNSQLQIITQNELAQVAAEDFDYFGSALAERPPKHPSDYALFAPMIRR